MVVWNKAYRREFVQRAGLSFPPGYYEDTPWTYPALISAETIATLDRVCVHYRQRRQGNILGTSSRKHFDIFEQYDRVFAHLDAHPELARWRPVLFRRMVDHLSTVFTKRGRLPRGTRAEFLRKARTHYRRYRAPGAPVRPRTRLRHALVRLGNHRTYRLLGLATSTHKKALRGVKGLLRKVRGGALQFHYRVQLRLPLRADRAVFSSYWGRGHGCNRAPWSPRSANSPRTSVRHGSRTPSTTIRSRPRRAACGPVRRRTGRRSPAPSTSSTTSTSTVGWSSAPARS